MGRGSMDAKNQQRELCLKQKAQVLVNILFVLFAVSGADAASAYIRVNQLGYEVGTINRAYLMSTRPENGAIFEVRNSQGITLESAPVTENVGTWGHFTVYALDFNVSNAGLYQIVVSGPVSASSPGFKVGVPTQLYSQALANALYFYRNERDGPDFIPTALRTAPGHLNDQQAAVYFTPKFDSNDNVIGKLKPTGAIIDGSGGWWDAGDYLKFVETHSYTVALQLIGIRDFSQQMGPGSTSDFTAEAKFGLDWLQRMWDDQTGTLYYQVGIGSINFETFGDHDIWRLPQEDDTFEGSNPAFRFVRNRPVFVAGPPHSKISPNLAGRLAADFAECFQVFRESDPDYANRCLMSAEHIFDLADPSPQGNLLTVAPFDFYPETEWRDDMELGATELLIALERAHKILPSGLPHTDPTFYLHRAAQWAHAYIHGPNDAADTLNLYDVSGLAHFDLYRAMTKTKGLSSQKLAVSPSDLLADLERALSNALAQGATDPFGFGFPWTTSDTASHGGGLSVMAKELALLTGLSTYDELSRRWMANVLGTNAWGASFIVGDGGVFPDCMQHQVANIVGSLDGTPPVLRGAVVEGPNSSGSTGFLPGMRVCPVGGGDKYRKFDGNGAVFIDNVQSFATVEPAIDLSATSFLMFAWRIAGAPSAIE